MSAPADAKAEDADAKAKPHKTKITCMLVWTSAAISVGSGFQHGYSTGVVNAPTDIITLWIEKEMNMTKDHATLFWSFIVSIFCIGGIIGGAMTSIVANRLGRRKGLIANNFIAVVAAILMGVSKYASSPPILIVGRLVIGVNCGINAGVAPMYLTEIAPMKIRGAIGSFYQLTITISILVAQLISLQAVMGNDRLWSILFALIIIPAIYQMLALLMCPESPKFLLTKGEDEKAMSACIALSGKEHATAEYESYKHEIEEAKKLPKVHLKDMFTNSKYRTPLIIIVILMLAQQFSGVNAVIFYSTQIFKIGDIGADKAQYLTVGVGLVNVLMTIVSVYLVEATGRKPLLFIGFFGMAAVTTVLLVCLLFAESNRAALFIAIAAVYIYQILFATGAGSIPWIIGSELFVTPARPLGLSLAIPVNWFGVFIVGLIFLPLKNSMGPYVFLIFIVCQALSGVFILFLVPETKNRPIEEITAKF